MIEVFCRIVVCVCLKSPSFALLCLIHICLHNSPHLFLHLHLVRLPLYLSLWSSTSPSNATPQGRLCFGRMALTLTGFQTTLEDDLQEARQQSRNRPQAREITGDGQREVGDHGSRTESRDEVHDAVGSPGHREAELEPAWTERQAFKQLPGDHGNRVERSHEGHHVVGCSVMSAGGQHKEAAEQEAVPLCWQFSGVRRRDNPISVGKCDRNRATSHRGQLSVSSLSLWAASKCSSLVLPYFTRRGPGQITKTVFEALSKSLWHHVDGTPSDSSRKIFQGHDIRTEGGDRGYEHEETQVG